MDCALLTDCPFFHDRMRSMPTTAEVLKRQYCLQDWEGCARCMVFTELGREAVPGDLYPYQVERAEEILAASQAHPQRAEDQGD